MEIHDILLTFWVNLSLSVFNNKSNFKDWHCTILLPQLITIIITTFIIMIIMICYYLKLKKVSELDTPKGFVLCVEIIIRWVEHQIIDLMGPKYKFLTVYFVYLLLYIGIGNLLAIIGLAPISSSYTIPFSIGVITFIGIYYFGIKYQKMMYLKKFINPIELLTQFVPLLSISFRLFGNILGGTVVVSLVMDFLESVWIRIPRFSLIPINLLSIMILPFLSLYFDVFGGLIQAYIFSILTISYWAMAISVTSSKLKSNIMNGNVLTKIKRDRNYFSNKQIK